MDVLSLGIFVVDVLGRPIDRFPDKGKLALFDELEIHSGGCANNTAIALARLGISVGAMGKIGNDAFGNLILQTLTENGVDTTGMVTAENPQGTGPRATSPGHTIARDRPPRYGMTGPRATSRGNQGTVGTSFTFVAVASDGERSFCHYLGANGEFTEAELNWDIIKTAKILHIGGALVMPKFDGEPMANILRKAKALGITTSLDTAWDATGKWLETLEPCLPYVDIFLPSLEEARHLVTSKSPPLQEIAQFFRDYGIHTVAIKMGTQGSYVCRGPVGGTSLSRHPAEEIFVPAYPVNVVDTTGAGDAYVAGFLAGTVMGWDLKATAELASATGAACVTAIGTTAGIQNLEETLKIKNEWRGTGSRPT